MAANKPTPEEQLLNLIEDAGAPGAVGHKRKKSQPFSFLKVNALVSFLPAFAASLKKGAVKLKGGGGEPNLKVWNNVLAVFVVVLFVYLTGDFVLGRLDIGQFAKKTALVKARSLKENPVPEVKLFLYYLEMVQRRDIFSPVRLVGAENPDDETKKVLAALIKDLKLVGISWGEDPEVIIEDTKVNKTYFLKTGDTISKFKIETILKDKVILESEGQKMELM